MLSHSIDWHLLDVVRNILNMQRYVTSVAGQTCNFSGKAAKGGSQYLCLNENVALLRHRQSYRSDMASLAWPTSRVGKTCHENVWSTTGFCDMKIYQEASADMQGQQITFKNKIVLKTFASAMIYFDFERTAETKYQRSQCQGKGKPRDFERPH